MFGFLAVLGPVGWGAAAIGTVVTIAIASSSDDSDTTTTYSDKEEKENEAKENARISRKQDILKDVEKYKKMSITRIQKKYNTVIKFNGTKAKIISSDDRLNNSIKLLQKENKDIGKVIKELESMKNAAIS